MYMCNSKNDFNRCIKKKLIKMLLPIRCYSCNKILGNKSIELQKYKDNERDKKEGYKTFFEEQNIHRYCCQKIIMSNIDLYVIRDEIKYSKTIQIKKILETKKICIAK